MTKDMTQGSPLKLILAFAVPLMLGSLFQQFYNLADTIIVGRFVGVEALVGSVGGLNYLVLGFVNGIACGFSIPISWTFGAKDYSEMRRYTANTVWLSLFFAAVLTVVTVALTRAVLVWTNTPDNIIDIADIYIRTIFWGIPFTLLYNVTSALMRALGDSKRPLYFLLVASVLNIGLDLLGQARNFLSYAAELNGCGDEDTLAFGRDERQYSNLLLVEQPNGNFADTIARQFFIDVWHVALYSRLVNSRDAQLAAIAAKGLKEVRYHQRFSRGWLERLGNGTELSNRKMQQAVDNLWRFTGELFLADEVELSLVEQGIAVDPRELQAEWQSAVHTALLDSGLQIPQEAAFRSGGKQGLHSEHLGPLLAEMQYLQRSHPGLQW